MGFSSKFSKTFSFIPLFFAASDELLRIHAGNRTKVMIIRMRSVPAIDATAMNSLENLYKKCQNRGITLVLSHVNEQPLNAMKKSGLYKAVGKENFCPNIDTALERAKSI